MSRKPLGLSYDRKVKRLKDRQRKARRDLCPTGKVPYETEDGAVWFGNQENMRAYLCPYCEKWHLTKRVNGF